MTREEAINILYGIRADNLNLNDAYTKDKYEALGMAIEALKQEPCEDTISRKSIKQKLQEHHDFFVNAYGGFSNLPQNDKSRVDEITNCIAMVVNEPSVTPQEPRKGHWIEYTRVLIPEPFNKWEQAWYCSECGYGNQESDESAWLEWNYCPKCGAKMEVEDGNGKRK